MPYDDFIGDAEKKFNEKWGVTERVNDAGMVINIKEKTPPKAKTKKYLCYEVEMGELKWIADDMEISEDYWHERRPELDKTIP